MYIRSTASDTFAEDDVYGARAGGHKAHGFSPNCCRLVTRLRRQAKKVSKHQLAVQAAKPENFLFSGTLKSRRSRI